MLSKHLFHFAMVHNEYGNSGDLFKGLIPLFSPILTGKYGQKFEPKMFIHDLETSYGLKLHPYVAEQFVPKMVQAGLLFEAPSSKYEKSFIIGKIEPAVDKELESKIKSIFENYEKLCTEYVKRVNLQPKVFDYGQEFSKRLARADYNNEAGFTGNETSFGTIAKSYESTLDYAFYRLVGLLIEKGGKSLEVLEAAYSGALLAEVILSLKEPNFEKDCIEGKKFYLDTSILINILGFNDSYSVECSRDILKQIKDLKGIATTTESYIAEVNNSIRRAIKNHDEKGERTSSISLYMSKNPNKVIDVRHSQTRVKSLLEDSGIDISPKLTNISNKISSIRATTLRDNILSKLSSWYKHEEAALHDAETVAYVVSDHGYKSVEQIVESKSFYITHNCKQVNTVNDYLYSHNIFVKPDITTILSEKNFAVFLWVLTGGKGKDIASNSLLSNCSKVMEMHRDVFIRISSFLNDLTEEQEKIFEDIINNDRALNCFMDEVAGDINQVTKENISSIAESSLSKLIEEVKEEATDKIQAIQSDFAQQKGSFEILESKFDRAINTIKQKANIENKLEIELQKKQDELDLLKAEASNKQQISNVEGNKQISSKYKAMVATAEKCKKITENTLILLFSVMFCFLLFNLTEVVLANGAENKYIKIKPGLAEILPWFVMLFTFWKVPEWLLGWPIKKISGYVYSIMSPEQ